MTDLITRIQNVGIHPCSDQTAITYDDAVEIRDIMKRECIDAINNEPFDMSCSDFPYRREHQEEGLNIAIKAIENIE